MRSNFKSTLFILTALKTTLCKSAAFDQSSTSVTEVPVESFNLTASKIQENLSSQAYPENVKNIITILSKVFPSPSYFSDFIKEAKNIILNICDRYETIKSEDLCYIFGMTLDGLKVSKNTERTFKALFVDNGEALGENCNVIEKDFKNGNRSLLFKDIWKKFEALLDVDELVLLIETIQTPIKARYFAKFLNRNIRFTRDFEIQVINTNPNEKQTKAIEAFTKYRNAFVDAHSAFHINFSEVFNKLSDFYYDHFQNIELQTENTQEFFCACYKLIREVGAIYSTYKKCF